MDDRSQKLEHLKKGVELTEYAVPVLCIGTRTARIMASSYAQAVKEAEEKIEQDLRYASENRLSDLKVKALAPTMVLPPEERAAWPYWGYGWYGTDGCDWRQYRTDKGPGSIPESAEESWPMPPFVDGREEAR